MAFLSHCLLQERRQGIVQHEYVHDQSLRNFVQNLPTFVDHLGARLEVDGPSTLTVDTAYGGGSFVIVDAQVLALTLLNLRRVTLPSCSFASPMLRMNSLTFNHPENPDWNHISFCLFAGKLEK